MRAIAPGILITLAEITDREQCTDDIKRAQIELNKAKALKEKWTRA